MLRYLFLSVCLLSACSTVPTTPEMKFQNVDVSATRKIRTKNVVTNETEKQVNGPVLSASAQQQETFRHDTEQALTSLWKEFPQKSYAVSVGKMEIMGTQGDTATIKFTVTFNWDKDWLVKFQQVCKKYSTDKEIGADITNGGNNDKSPFIKMHFTNRALMHNNLSSATYTINQPDIERNSGLIPHLLGADTRVSPTLLVAFMDKNDNMITAQKTIVNIQHKMVGNLFQSSMPMVAYSQYTNLAWILDETYTTECSLDINIKELKDVVSLKAKVMALTL